MSFMYTTLDQALFDLRLFSQAHHAEGKALILLRMGDQFTISREVPSLSENIVAVAIAGTVFNTEAAEGSAQLYGVKDGKQVFLGHTPTPPKMRARELAAEMFGGFEEGDGSDAELCFAAMEQLIKEHME